MADNDVSGLVLEIVHDIILPKIQELFTDF